MRPLSVSLVAIALCTIAGAVQESATRPDGLYAVIRTSKGTIVARLEADLTPMTVASFVGLAEGTIENNAFDPGRPYYDGSVYHRVVPGHVIQTGVPRSDRAKNPGYTFPNEVHARLSHNHAGALNMANSGPHTNAAQFCITLGDRSYLDGDFTVFGEVVEGLDVVMRIVQGDVMETVRIVRIGDKARSFHPTTESFRALVKAAEQRVAAHVGRKQQAEREWVARNYPQAVEPPSADAPAPAASVRVRYRGSEVRYLGDVLGRDGPPIDAIPFGSNANGVPGFVDPPQVFTVEPGKTKINPGLDRAIAAMRPGDRRSVIVPAELAYGRAGLYPPETPGKRRFVISPHAMLVYDVEVLPNQ